MSTGGATMKKSDRSFEVVSSSLKFTGGRFIARSPYAAALHALASICQGKKNCHNITITLRETTRGSKNKEYTYKGGRKPVNVTVERDGVKVTFKHRYHVKSMN